MRWGVLVLGWIFVLVGLLLQLWGCGFLLLCFCLVCVVDWELLAVSLVLLGWCRSLCFWGLELVVVYLG